MCMLEEGRGSAVLYMGFRYGVVGSQHAGDPRCRYDIAFHQADGYLPGCRLLLHVGQYQILLHVG